MENSHSLTAKVLGVVCEHLNNDTDFKFLQDVVVTGIIDEVRDILRCNAKSIVASVIEVEQLHQTIKSKDAQIEHLEMMVVELQELLRKHRDSEESDTAFDISVRTEENIVRRGTK